MWKVARATSAAPTYLEGLHHGDAVFLDGGIWANNPVMLAVVEALSAYKATLDQIEVLSIGTGTHPVVIKCSPLLGGKVSWTKAIHCAMHLNTDNAGSQARLLLGPEKYMRLEPPVDRKEIDLDDYDAAWAALPIHAEKAVDDNIDRIAHFFRDPAAPRERLYSRSNA